MTVETFLHSINRCYAKEVANKLPTIADLPTNSFTNEGDIDIGMLEDFAEHQADQFIRSVVNRMIAIKRFQSARATGEELDIREIWPLVADSITQIPSESVISSIGSQGFLSIPLFKYDSVMNDFDFIRLHIWDSSLSVYIDKETTNRFGIHTHSFYAKSWIIAGTVVNDRYIVSEHNGDLNASLFTVEYNKTLNEINQHTSVAKNTGINVNVKKISHEEHMQGSTYEISKGHYHRSDSLGHQGLSATLFCFTGKDGVAASSYVVGPKEINESIINRKMHIDPNPLFKKITSEI